ncbi:MAG: hypothetical protein P8165_06420 [Deltaproteobacteria bacterium]
MVRDRVTITDVTLREFGQNVPKMHLHLFTPDIRSRIARDLMAIGFLNIEVFSCIHPKVAPAMDEAALKEIAGNLGRIDGMHIITLVPNLAGYRRFCALGLGPEGCDHTIGIFFSAVEVHNRLNLGRSIEETVSEYRTILKDASKRHIRVVAYVSAAFGFREPEKGSIIHPDAGEINRHIDRLFDLGARAVTLSDLQGVAGPDETKKMWNEILELRKGKDLEKLGYHPHHVSGDAALNNSRVAFELGLRRFDASLGGTGGCITGAPGNQPTEGLVRLFHNAGVKTGIHEKGVFALAERVRRDLYSRIPLAGSSPSEAREA